MAIKSYIKIKPIKDDGPFAGSFDEIRKGINRTGVVVENIANNNVETHKLIQFEKEWLSTTTEKETEVAKEEQKDEEKGFKKWFKGFRNMFRLKNRREQEKKDEAPAEPGAEPEEKPPNKLKQAGGGFLGNFTKLLTSIFKFVMMQVLLNWLSDPEKAKKAGKVFNLVMALGKFALKIATWGIDTLASGIINVFGGFKEGPIKGTLGALFGFLQIFAGFKTLQYLLNPFKAVSDVKKVAGLFKNTTEKEVEWKKQEQWRKFGYKDKETGKIYTEEEYKAQKKSVERQQKKLRAQGKNDQARKVGKGFNNRVNNPTRLQKGKNVGKGIGGKLMKPGAQKGLAVAGGLSRMASGIAMGEDKTTAVGAGLGQAAGGMLGAAAGTALLGPFLGPFAPIVGNAIGSFLGEWVGKTFLPMIKPLFEPIQKMFGMWFGLIKQIADETGITEFLGTFFKFVGEIGKVLFNIIGWIMKPITWLLGGAIKVLGNIIGFIIKWAKNIFAFMINPLGSAWKVIRGGDPGKDVKLEEFGDGGEMVVTEGKPARKLQSFAGGGPTRISLTAEDVEPAQFVYSHQRFTSKITEHVKNGELIELKKEKEFYEVMGSIYYHILLKHHDDILGKLISMKLLKPHHTIKDVIEGNAAKHIKPEILYPIFKGSEAQKLSDEESRERTKAFYKRHNLEIGQSWVADNFAKGGEVNIKNINNAYFERGGEVKNIHNNFFARGGEVKTKPIKSVYKVPQFSMGGNVPDLGDIEAMTETRDMALKEFQYKNQRDSDMENIILPPRIITIQSTVPIINNIAAGNKATPVYTAPSPLFTC